MVISPLKIVSYEQLKKLRELDPAAPGWVVQPYVLKALRLEQDGPELPPR